MTTSGTCAWNGVPVACSPTMADADPWETAFSGFTSAEELPPELGERLVAALAEPKPRDALVTLVRRLRRDGHPDVEPHVVERALRTALARAGTASPLPERGATGRAPFGALEPDPGVRAIEVASAVVDGREPPDNVKFEAELLAFWLRGTMPKGDLGQVGPMATRVSVLAAFDAMGLVSARTRAARREVVAGWDAKLDQALAKRDLEGQSLGRAYLVGVRNARDSYTHLLDARAGDRAALEAFVASLRRSDAACRTPPDDVESLAAWLVAAHELGLVAALDVDHGGLRAARARLAHRLAGQLDAVLDRCPLDLLDPVLEPLLVRALASLVREGLGSFDARRVRAVLERYAEAGAFGGGSALPLARLVRLVEREEGDVVARAFLLRGAFQTMRRRGVPPASVTKRSDLARLLAACEGTEAGRAAAHWFGVGSPDERDEPRVLLAIARDFAGVEWTAEDRADEGASLDAALAFFRGAGFPADDASGTRLVALPRRLARLGRAAPLTQPGGPSTLALHLDVLRGRHGERYFLPRAFRSGVAGLATVARDERYAVPLDASRNLDDAYRALAALREQAALGSVGRRHVTALQEAMERVLPLEFRARLGVELGARRGAVELSCAAPALPWEFVRVKAGTGEKPLASLAPTYRARARASAGAADPGRTVRSLLVLADRGYEGVDAELDAISAAFAGPGCRVKVVDRVNDVQASLVEGAWDVVHYAGHQGPSHDTTPSLALSGGHYPLLELVDQTAAQPPSLLFLNACSTLAPTAVDDAAGFVDFGALEPLLASAIPNVLGTVWDIRPPGVHFVRTLYTALAAGESTIDALHEARTSVAGILAWAGVYPAYVLYATCEP